MHVVAYWIIFVMATIKSLSDNSNIVFLLALTSIVYLSSFSLRTFLILSIASDIDWNLEICIIFETLDFVYIFCFNSLFSWHHFSKRRGFDTMLLPGGDRSTGSRQRQYWHLRWGAPHYWWVWMGVSSLQMSPLTPWWEEAHFLWVTVKVSALHWSSSYTPVVREHVSEWVIGAR